MAYNAFFVKISQRRIMKILALILLIAGCIGLCCFNMELYGEIYRYLPLLCFLPLIAIKDIEKIFDLFVALVLASVVAYVLKFAILYLATNMHFESMLSFARRPINGEYNGFPSGHATMAFVGVAFAYLYYSYKWKIAFLCFGILVGISRILSLWHTPLQVFVGSLIGFFVALIILKFLAKASFMKKFKMRFIKKANEINCNQG